MSFANGIEPAGHASFGIFFPGFPGCLSAGATPEEALIEEIDAVAKNRSGLLAKAARAELARRRGAA